MHKPFFALMLMAMQPVIAHAAPPGKKMIMTDEFYGIPAFFTESHGKVTLGFNESARLFEFDSSNTHFESWCARLRRSMQEQKAVKVTVDAEGIVAIE